MWVPSDVLKGFMEESKKLWRIKKIILEAERERVNRKNYFAYDSAFRKIKAVLKEKQEEE